MDLVFLGDNNKRTKRRDTEGMDRLRSDLESAKRSIREREKMLKRIDLAASAGEMMVQDARANFNTNRERLESRTYLLKGDIGEVKRVAELAK